MRYCDPADDNVKCDDDYVKKDVLKVSCMR